MKMQKIMFMIIMAVAIMQQQVHTRHLTHHVQPPVAEAPEVMSPPPPPPPPSSSPSPSRTYIVGDGIGWTIPYGEPDLYDVWAFNKSFIVGDVLVFNVGIVEDHSVAEVSRTAFDSCDATTITMADSHFIFPDPVSITLTHPGPNYYNICTLPTHCSWGQKLAINVTTTRSPSIFSAPPMAEHSISYADIDNMYIPPPSTSSSTLSLAPSPPDDVINYAPDPEAAPSSAPPPLMMTSLPVALLSIALAAFLC